MWNLRNFGRIGALSAAFAASLSPDLPAATSSAPALVSDRPGDGSDLIDISRVAPIERPDSGAGKMLPVTGNPLWAIPLSQFIATRERPIFLATRRPPAPAAIPSPVEQVVVPPPPPNNLELPPLTLVGTVLGNGDAIAVFFNRTDQALVRLRSGDSSGGWSVASVSKGEVVLTRAGRSEVFALRPSDAPNGAAK